MARQHENCAPFRLEPFEPRQLLSASTAGAAATPAPPSRPDIVGTVFLDRNADGTRGIFERGLRGFTVDLVDSTGTTIDSLHSDRRGRFRFGGLTDGSTYTVKIEAKDGFAATTATTASVTIATDGVQRVAVGEKRVAAPATVPSTGSQPTNSSGSTDDTGDARATPTVPAKPSIVGIVYLDRDADGVLGKRERGLVGFTVTLTDGTGATIATTTTDRIGRYRFAGIADGTYTVTITAKDGFTASGAQTASVMVASGKLPRSAFGETRTGSSTEPTTDPKTAPPTKSATGRPGRGQRGSTGTTGGGPDGSDAGSTPGTQTGTETEADTGSSSTPGRRHGRRPPPGGADTTVLTGSTDSSTGSATGDPAGDAGSPPDTGTAPDCSPPVTAPDSGTVPGGEIAPYGSV